MKFIIFCTLLLVCTFSNLDSVRGQVQSNEMHHENINDFRQTIEQNREYFKRVPQQKGNGSKPFRRWQDFWGKRLSNDGKFPVLSKITRDAVQYIADNDAYASKKWKELGPFVIPYNTLAYPSSGLGRISCIAINPLRDSRMLIGAASGGLWTSSNSGTTWDAVPFSQIMSVGITDICFSKVDTNVVYAATGDIDGIALSRNYSIGIIRSDDGGKKWRLAGDTTFYDENYLISAIRTFPENKYSAVAATNRGLIFTDDGFETIKSRALTDYYIRNLAVSVDNPDLMLAAVYDNDSHSILKSEDRGLTWTKVLNIPQSSRISISFSKFSPSTVFAVAVKAADGGFEGFYLSKNSGDTWIKQSESPNILGADVAGKVVGGQGNYDLCIETSPEDSNVVYVAGVNLWKTTDLGMTWHLVTHWSGDGNFPFVHADHHALAFSQNGSLFSGNDGGIYVSKDLGMTWQDNSNGLSIAQIYRLDVFRDNPNKVIVGTQDNGTLLADKISWSHIFGGDGMGCIYVPDDALEMFFSINNGSIYRSTRGGEKPDLVLNEAATGEKSTWISVLALNPKNQNTVYAGYWNVWRSTDFGSTVSWQKISDFGDEVPVNCILNPESDTNRIYVGKKHVLYVTYDDGKNWQREYTAETEITSIVCDSSNTVYIACSGYLADQKVFRKIGSRWENISLNLPNVPVNSIAVDRTGGFDVTYVGTDIGCFWLNPLLHKWQMFGTEMPHVVIDDMKIHVQSGKLFAGTYGRGLWQISLVKISRDLKVSALKTTQLCPGETFIVSANSDNSVFWSNGETGKEIEISKSGAYFAYSIDAVGNISVSDSFFVEIAEAKVIANKSVYCFGDVARLSSSTEMKSIEWNTGETADSIDVTSSGLYWFEGRNMQNCEVRSDTTDLIFHDLPAKPNIIRVENTLMTDISDTVNFEIHWYAGDSLVGRNNVIQEISTLGDYHVTITNKYGCTVSSDVFPITSSVKSENIYRYVDKIILSSGEELNLYVKGRISEVSVFDIKGGQYHVEWEFLPATGLVRADIPLTGSFVVVMYKTDGTAEVILVNKN